jgi:hypothetical protein
MKFASETHRPLSSFAFRYIRKNIMSGGMISTRARNPGKVKSVTSDRVVCAVILETAIGELRLNHHVALGADHATQGGR